MAAEVIAAIATAPGRGGIGVVRVSGPDLGALAAGLLGQLPAPRHATLASFHDAAGAVLDRGIALYFPAPHSYTGEEVLELQGHGGPAVLNLVLARCLELGARIAEPGEFTKRAFLNDKLDLAQAEGIADLIEAASAAAARCAARSLSGEFSAAINGVGRQLIDLRMHVEATLDFPEEEVEFLKQADAERRLGAIGAELARVQAAARQGSLLREGVHAVLVGQPNVGKSSLLNALAGEEIAIVTEVPGTTRDAIRQAIQIEGVPLHVVDTAGLRESADRVEQIGMQRTRSAIERADLALLIVDRSQGETAGDRAILQSLPPGLPVLKLHNKIDLSGDAPRVTVADGQREVWLSARTGAGLELLRRELLAAAGWQPGGEGAFMARARHLAALEAARARVAAAAGQLARLELMAEELRLAQQALAQITGEFTPDDLLGEIFSRFCIGK